MIAYDFVNVNPKAEKSKKNLKSKGEKLWRTLKMPAITISD